MSGFLDERVRGTKPLSHERYHIGIGTPATDALTCHLWNIQICRVSFQNIACNKDILMFQTHGGSLSFFLPSV